MNRAPELPAGTVPAGATHFYHDPSRLKPGTQAWRKQEGDKWYMFADGEWRVIKGSNAHMFVPIEQVLRPAWNGEGLPPVGAVCEYSIGDTDEWHTCEIRYASAQLVVLNNETWGDQASSSRVKFRPIRTAEQIAAEEREAAIAEIMRASELRARDGCREVAAAIYDAGYRKQVQP